VVIHENVLATHYRFSSNGDTKAAKIFLDNNSTREQKQNIRNPQNNFIQINRVTITQEQLQAFTTSATAKAFDVLKSVRIGLAKFNFFKTSCA
jgi:hypothetical protein